MQPPSPSAESQTIRIEPPDPARLAEQINAILTAETNTDRRLELLLHQTVGLVNAAGVFFFTKHGDQVSPVGQLISKQALNWSDNLAKECEEIASTAMGERKALLTPLSPSDGVSVISCPVPGRPEDKYFCLSVLVILGDHAAEPYLIVLQLLGRHHGADTEWNRTLTAASIDSGARSSC